MDKAGNQDQKHNKDLIEDLEKNMLIKKLKKKRIIKKNKFKYLLN